VFRGFFIDLHFCIEWRLTGVLMKILAVITAISGFIGVVFGAFGTHGLRGTVEPELLSVWQTAMQYQMFHVLVLLSIIIAGSRQSNRLLTISGWLFVAGTVLFSGSLYALVITGIKSLGMVTPFGGVLFLLGWLVLSFALVKFINAQQVTEE
jgi:uncharacterized membrane protein YgdD (TMEM256/DUF423 family)|tara:strand:- start:4247 stop:4702 length:456 start_codon:yes stop_codon:yes gene_type:complete